ncbi:MAG: hypothetical protein RIR73_1632 [Chloroflexota bacterium]|jgi:ubiquinone/menaquinone biosynthesis C-methylase UbiE
MSFFTKDQIFEAVYSIYRISNIAANYLKLEQSYRHFLTMVKVLSLESSNPKPNTMKAEYHAT